MPRRLLLRALFVTLFLSATVACRLLKTPSPTPLPVRTKAPTLTPLPTISPTDVPTATPLGAPSPAPTAEPTPADDAAIALYAAGSREESRLIELASDGISVALHHTAYRGAAVSRDGHWVATPNAPLPADAMVIAELEGDATYTVPVTSNFDPYGAAFNAKASRLAFTELGPPEAERTPWALVVVNLQDGSTARFPATMRSDTELLPGVPIGWSGPELLINTFLPFTEVGSAGLWAVALPFNTGSVPFSDLDRRQILRGGQYLFDPELSPGAGELLYLNRDDDYTPEDYQPVAYDLAVNQLGVFDMADGSSELLVEETRGGALGGDAAWSPEGERALFALGNYGNGTFASLILHTVDRNGAAAEVGPVPLPPEGFLVSLDWCAQNTALVVVAKSQGEHEMHTIDVGTGESSLVASEEHIEVLGCVPRAASAGGGNADVVHVRAVQTAGPSPGSGETTWTFHVTVDHPDTGWEDYADGWDVAVPEGEVLKPDPGNDFTRLLLHPHVDEQPFTRSQSGIVVPAGVTEVRVRAHDIVDGYGGREVTVDLTESSGPSFEVER